MFGCRVRPQTSASTPPPTARSSITRCLQHWLGPSHTRDIHPVFPKDAFSLLPISVVRLPHPTWGRYPLPRNPSGRSAEGESFSETLRARMRHSRSQRIVGFLFGFSLASSYAAYHLLDEYKLASAALQASVLELQESTQKVHSV